MGSNSSHLVQSNNDQLMSAATKQYLANVPSLSVAGESMTPAQIAQLFDDRVASTQTVQTATAGRTAAVKANRDKRAQTASKVKAYTTIIQGMFAESPDTLAAFGLTPRKVALSFSSWCGVRGSSVVTVLAERLGWRARKGL